MKILKLILFIYGLMCITGQALAAEVAINPQTKIVTLGQTFDLDVTIDPRGTRIAGAQVNIGFNSSLFRVNNISEGNLFNRNGTNTFFNGGTINNSTGTAINIFNSIIGNRNVTTRGTFIIINVTAIGITGTSGFDLSNVKISDPNGLAVRLNATNGSFTISAPSINVVSPNGGETWIRGTSNMITWNSTYIQGPNVKLELLKNGYTVGTITSSTPNDGSHAWSITSSRAPGTDYKVRITSTTNSAYNDTSDSNFTISALTPKTGDINGDGKLTLVDAIYLARHVGGFSRYEIIYADGDINANGKVTVVDAIYLAKHVGGFIGYEKLY